MPTTRRETPMTIHPADTAPSDPSPLDPPPPPPNPPPPAPPPRAPPPPLAPPPTLDQEFDDAAAEAARTAIAGLAGAAESLVAELRDNPAYGLADLLRVGHDRGGHGGAA